MKRIIFCCLAILMIATTMNSAPLEPIQEKAKKEIFSALKKVGKNVRNKEEDALLFEYNGATYEVSIHTLNPEILYLVLELNFEISKDIDNWAAIECANLAAGGKPVCAYAGYGTLFFTCEMYAHNAKPFIAVLPQMLIALDESANLFKDMYDEIPETISNSDMSTNDYLRENTSNEPLEKNKIEVIGQLLCTDAHEWACETIELRDNKTIISKVVYPKVAGTYVYSTKEEFIEDSRTGRRFYLIDSSIGTEKNPIILRDADALTFTEYYPALPSDVKYVNISSGTEYYVKGLRVR